MPTPRELIERVHTLFLAGDVDGIASLVAEDVVIENPFAPAGHPARVEGREAFRARLAARMGGGIRFDRFTDVAWHPSTDPEVVVVEFELHGRIPEHAFARRYIQVVRVRDDRVIHWRDYFDPNVGART
ncbi:nuclear transport factor 2 family protein [Actinophytocola sp.]|uniref:nuclear transport factor 2 family protein n=1 Tax=Actinophytocola sp. TaxID=1872138 RepID=UPI002D7E2BF9|nr:nuclear transport factor 2 family protein [Actinophytocola sp.]HET9139888.1 nuclear transport factor 2 family protein [Actinophytocola sp.]